MALWRLKVRVRVKDQDKCQWSCLWSLQQRHYYQAEGFRLPTEAEQEYMLRACRHGQWKVLLWR